MHSIVHITLACTHTTTHTLIHKGETATASTQKKNASCHFVWAAHSLDARPLLLLLLLGFGEEESKNNGKNCWWGHCLCFSEFCSLHKHNLLILVLYVSHIEHVTITLDFDSARDVHTEYPAQSSWVNGFITKIYCLFKYAIQIVMWRFIKMCKQFHLNFNF